MPQPTMYRRAPRGRPSIGFQLEIPPGVEVRDGPVLHCREVRQDGRVVGELEVIMFSAALVIDRDGILAEKACQAMCDLASLRNGAIAMPVALPGASGFRAAAVHKAALPYLYVFAVAPPDLGVDGGLLITVRTAGPDWAVADHVLRSLRILTHNGRVATNYEADEGPVLPMIGPLRD